MDICQLSIFATPCQYLSYLWLGMLVGGVAAVVGAIIEYRRARYRRPPSERRLPGCMILVAGALGGTGTVALIASTLAGSPLPALVMGLGVGAGFFLSFVLLVIGWVLWEQVLDKVKGNSDHKPTH